MNSTSPRSPRPARAVDAEAAQWVTRRRAGLAVDEKSALAAWLAADGAHAEAFRRLDTMAEALQRARVAGAGDEIVTQLKIRERKRRTRRRTLAAAAGGAAVLAFLAAVWPVATRQTISPAAPVAAQRFEPVRRLADGTVVELNAGAELAVNFEATVRRVTLLRGEALFRVTKDPARPFVVQAGDVAVRAVGTAFSVRLVVGAVDVLVTEGKVAVADAADGRTLLPTTSAHDAAPVLSPGQSVTVGAAGAGPRSVRVAEVAPPEIAARLAWRVSRLEFAGVELAQAAAQMNRINHVQIVPADEAVGRLRVTATFAPDDPQTFARLAAASLGLEVEDRGDGRIVLRATSPSPKRN